jgi:hypothetical protein
VDLPQFASWLGEFQSSIVDIPDTAMSNPFHSPLVMQQERSLTAYACPSADIRQLPAAHRRFEMSDGRPLSRAEQVEPALEPPAAEPALEPPAAEPALEQRELVPQSVLQAAFAELLDMIEPLAGHEQQRDPMPEPAPEQEWPQQNSMQEPAPFAWPERVWPEHAPQPASPQQDPALELPSLLDEHAPQPASPRQDLVLELPSLLDEHVPQPASPRQDPVPAEPAPLLQEVCADSRLKKCIQYSGEQYLQYRM